MRIRMLLAMIFVIALMYNCKTGNKTENESVADSALTEETDSTGLEEISGGFMGIKHHSMEQKDNVTLSGDPNYDFAVVMEIHHRHGIAMANEEVKYGADSTIRNLAKRLIESQQGELEEINGFIKNNKPGNSNEQFLKVMKSQMQKTREEMNENVKMTGNFDIDFISLMALHHKHGQDLAETEVKYGSGDMKNLAQQIVKKRNSEISELNKAK